MLIRRAKALGIHPNIPKHVLFYASAGPADDRGIAISNQPNLINQFAIWHGLA